MLSRAASDSPPGGGSVVPFAGLGAGPDALAAWAPAKVNLHLEVVGKRPDGYHAVETLILAVDLFDSLEVRDDPTGAIQLTCDAPGVPTGPTNLAHKAAAELQTRWAAGRGATIRLTKRIPHEAGLGGGSSDAAAVLAGLNRLWGLRRSVQELRDAAGRIGSDVGFFLTPPAGWCTGRGEVVEPEPVGRPLDLVVVKSPVGLSTADVYRRVTVPSAPVSGDAIRRAVRAGDPEAVARHLHNRLQEPAFTMRPEVAEAHRRLAGCGPLGCLMSGSGSSVFAVCRDRADAQRAAGRFRDGESDVPEGSRCRVFVVRSYCPKPR